MWTVGKGQELEEGGRIGLNPPLYGIPPEIAKRKFLRALGSSSETYTTNMATKKASAGPGPGRYQLVSNT